MLYSGTKSQNVEKIKFRNLFASLMRNIKMILSKEKKLRNRIINISLLLVLSRWTYGVFVKKVWEVPLL